jgi:hypothetical protein
VASRLSALSLTLAGIMEQLSAAAWKKPAVVGHRRDRGKMIPRAAERRWPSAPTRASGR